MSRRIVCIVIPAVLLFLAAASSALAGPEPRSHISPPRSSAYGVTYPEWGAKFWKWSLGIPANETHPGLDPGRATNCGEQYQSGQVWFLAGTYATFTDLETGDVVGNAERTCTLPAGRALLVSPMTVECSTLEGNGASADVLAACARSYLDQAHDLAVEVDGVAVENIERYRFASAADTFTVPQPNLLGIEAPRPNPSLFVAEGFLTLVLPLSEGQHDIRFSGHLGTSPGEFRTDVRYHLAVK